MYIFTFFMFSDSFMRDRGRKMGVGHTKKQHRSPDAALLSIMENTYYLLDVYLTAQ